MSAVHKRLHYGMRQEFKLLARVMSEYLPQEYPYAVMGGDRAIMRQDFDDRVDVVPVSNPNFSRRHSVFLWRNLSYRWLCRPCKYTICTKRIVVCMRLWVLMT